ADAEAPVEVDAGLDRDDVAGGKHVARLGREARRLVHVEPQPVAEAVAHRAAERARVDDAPGERVGLDARDAGVDAVERALLRGENRRVRLLRLAVERAGRERARVVRRVAADRAAGVDHDELAGADLPVAGTRVRPRARRAGADDRLERLRL